MKDFLIIGGGMAGLSTAARLSELGSVVLLEAEDALGYHASGRSAAMFEENYGSPSTIALNRASRAYHEAAGVLSPRGFLCVGLPHEDAATGETIAELGMDEVTLAEARAMVPIIADEITRAGYHHDALEIDTDTLLQGFARTARGNRAEIVTKAPVSAIARTELGWAAIAPGATYEARILVNAAGAWVDEIAKLAGIAPLGVTPCRRSMARVPAPGGQDVGGWPVLFGPGETWYAKPDAGKWLISPADEDPVPPQDAWADDMVLAEGIARYEAHVTEPVTRVEMTWAGLRTFSPDRSLVIGRDPAEETFVWVAGQGGYGIQSCPAYSQLAADVLGGRAAELDPSVVQALSPARFQR
ncbi:NAD(P)/FAD-dependent oxidoreductase [Candidatus Rhodobacter oscarellae]|nr:FAD-dependent oxidoreductase [Candidatus Rhodobacter lobularis]